MARPVRIGDAAVTPARATTGIPSIEPYPFPTEDELPCGQMAWEIDPSRAVLLVHDMQRYFLRPFLEPMRSELIGNVVELRDRCRARGVPVVYTAQPGGMSPTERGLLLDVWGPGMTRDEADRCIVDELTPDAGEVVVTKWRYSALVRTDLRERLSSAGRDQLVVCGVFAHVGILVTAIDAFSYDIQPFVVADAIADFSAEYHAWAVEYAAQRCAVVRTLARVLA